MTERKNGIKNSLKGTKQAKTQMKMPKTHTQKDTDRITRKEETLCFSPLFKSTLFLKIILVGRKNSVILCFMISV